MKLAFERLNKEEFKIYIYKNKYFYSASYILSEKEINDTYLNNFDIDIKKFNYFEIKIINIEKIKKGKVNQYV